MANRSIGTEFPEFPAMPEFSALLAQGWIDASWHNDTCPSVTRGNVQLWVDHPDPNERECRGEPRFVANVSDTDGKTRAIYASDNLPEILAIIAE